MKKTLRNEKNWKMPLLVLVTQITNWGKVSAMLHESAGDGSNSQVILKWPRY